MLSDMSAIEIFTSGKESICANKISIKETEKSFQLLKEEARGIALPVSQLLFVVSQGMHLAKLPFS